MQGIRVDPGQKIDGVWPVIRDGVATLGALYEKRSKSTPTGLFFLYKYIEDTGSGQGVAGARGRHSEGEA